MADETIDPATLELENQLRRLDSITDPASRAAATDLVAAVLQFHTAALERMLELVEAQESGAAVVNGFDRDPLVRSMLLIHDLHPESVATRVRRAIADLEPTARKRGASVQVVEASAGAVKIQLRNGKDGGGSFAPVVESALREAAPEAEIVIEEIGGASFVPLESLQSATAAMQK